MRDGDTRCQVGDWRDERGDHEDRQDRDDDDSENGGIHYPSEGGYADGDEAVARAVEFGLLFADSPHSGLSIGPTMYITVVVNRPFYPLIAEKRREWLCDLLETIALGSREHQYNSFDDTSCLVVHDSFQRDG